MRILGIDPGSRNAGYCIIETNTRTFCHIASGTIRLSKIDNFSLRLKNIYNDCQQIIELYSPDEISLESLIYVKSPTSLIKLAQARGAMIAAFSQTHENKIYEYAPNLIKSTVTGHGHADKKSIAKAAKILLSYHHFDSEDSSDAAAIALCHAFLLGSNSGVIKSKARNSLAKSVEHKLD